MPHLSSKQIKKKTHQRIGEQLIKIVAAAGGRENSRRLIIELLTPTERLMIAKRLAMIIVFHRGYSSYRIRKILKVSSSTTRRFYRQVESGQYRYLANLLGQKNLKSDSDLWADIEKVLYFALPPRVGGRHRWRSFRVKP